MAEPKFEESLQKLESIVDDLEGGTLNLDDAIKKYEEGMKLSQSCYKKLQEIQKKVEVLIKEPSGRLSAKEFDASSAEDKDLPSPEAQKQKKPSRKKRPGGEELLF